MSNVGLTVFLFYFLRSGLNGFSQCSNRKFDFRGSGMRLPIKRNNLSGICYLKSLVLTELLTDESSLKMGEERSFVHGSFVNVLDYDFLPKIFNFV